MQVFISIVYKKNLNISMLMLIVSFSCLFSRLVGIHLYAMDLLMIPLIRIQYFHNHVAIALLISVFDYTSCAGKLIKFIQVMFVRADFQTKMEKVEFDTCIPSSNVQFVTVHENHFLLIGINRTLEILKLNANTEEFSSFQQLSVRHPIYYVKSLDAVGHVGVVSAYNGVSVFTVYYIDVLAKSVETRIEMNDLPRIQHVVSSALLFPDGLILMSKTQLQLLEYRSPLNKLTTKQIINVKCPKLAFWLSYMDLKWLIVTTCQTTMFYNYNDYLYSRFEVEAVVMDRPLSFRNESHEILIMQLQQDYGNIVSVLEGSRKGPLHRDGCQLAC